MLAIGDNCLPTGGIGAISEQMLKSIGKESVLCGCKITSLEKDSDGSVTVASADGNAVRAKYGCVLERRSGFSRLRNRGLHDSPIPSSTLLSYQAGVS